MPIQRVLVWKQTLRETLADDDHALAVSTIVIVKIPAGDERDAERREKAWRNSSKLRARILFAVCLRITLDRELESGAEVAPFPPRDDRADRDTFDARQFRDAPQDLFVERHNLIRRPAERHDGHMDRQHVMSGEARLRRLQRQQRR